MSSAQDAAKDVIGSAAADAERVVERAAQRAAALLAQHAEDKIEDTSERAATKALNKLLVGLGVDTSDPQAMIAMQKDFAYLRTWRQSIDAMKTQSLKTAVVVVVTGMLGACWAVFVYGWPGSR